MQKTVSVRCRDNSLWNDIICGLFMVMGLCVFAYSSFMTFPLLPIVIILCVIWGFIEEKYNINQFDILRYVLIIVLVPFVITVSAISS